MEGLRLVCGAGGVDFEAVSALIKREGMAERESGKLKLAFERSKAVFVYDGDELIGCGRMLTDYIYQGALYDVAVDSRYQGRGVGRAIVLKLIEGADGLNILLYATPGKEGFYERLGFSMAKTGMCRFCDSANARSRGFID